MINLRKIYKEIYEGTNISKTSALNAAYVAVGKSTFLIDDLIDLNKQYKELDQEIESSYVIDDLPWSQEEIEEVMSEDQRNEYRERECEYNETL